MRVTVQLAVVFVLLHLTPAVAPAVDIPKDIQRAMRIQKQNEGSILAMPGVRGIGIGRDKTNKDTELVFHVFVDRSAGTPELPSALEDIPVKELPAGLVVAQQALMGTSTSNPNGCYSGTTGFKAKFRDRKCLWGYITNNHVAVAGGANLCPNAAVIGTNQYSPSTGDNLCNNATDIGDLKAFSALNLGLGSDNLVDAAFVGNNYEDADNDVSNQIACNIGAPTTTTITPAAALGMAVQKCGRTTLHTTGVVATINVSLTVSYGVCGNAPFINQIHILAAAGSFSQAGDSGSPIVNMQNDPVGLLFAGDNINTYANPIDEVLNRVFADLVGPNDVFPEECKKPTTTDHTCSCSCASRKTGLSQIALQNLALFSRELGGGNIHKLRKAIIKDQEELIAIAESGDARFDGVRVALEEFKAANFELVEASFSTDMDTPGTGVITPENLAALDRLVRELSAVTTSKRLQRELRRIQKAPSQLPMEGRTLREAARLYDAMKFRLSDP
jgi:hypothetical protein